MKFKSILIANRSEIAVRVIRAARELGLETYAVYSEDDNEALHIPLADYACALKGRGASAYLDKAQIVAIAKAQGVQAIHPGYGFLSENVEFAKLCEAAGIVFIGPTTDHLSMFGDKIKARSVALASDIPCIEGTGSSISLEEAKAFYISLGKGAAIMVKAVSGGGGRGMRPVHSLDDLEDAFARCKSEAKAAFDNDALYVERLIQNPRHIEVQIIGDGTGAVSHLWERECTIQRRHQKIVEVAPSPSLSETMRERLTGVAKKLGEDVKYLGLGTVEFLVESSSNNSVVDDNAGIFFIEVNPRIQVEHTVTEQILSLDLVKAQIAIAQGSTLAEIDFTQDKIGKPNGYAVQLRINMETINPDGTTTPSGGCLSTFDLPSGPGIRVDTAGYLNYIPSPYFDSLLAKVIVSNVSGTYQETLRRAYQALCEINIAGVTTNLPFLLNLLDHPAFIANEISTGFIDQHIVALTKADTHHRQLFIASKSLGETTDALDASPEIPEGMTGVLSPLQGVVIDLFVNTGDRVVEGQKIAVVEAMKMEHELHADKDGIIEEICLSIGQVVKLNQLILLVGENEIGVGADNADSARNKPKNQNADKEQDKQARQARLDDLKARREVALAMGGSTKIDRQHNRGKLTVRERVDIFLDEGSFQEYGLLASHDHWKPGETVTPADGIVTGIGTVDGRPVCIIAEDATVMGGSCDDINGSKRMRMINIANKERIPFVCLLDGAGFRAQAMLHSTEGAPGIGHTLAFARQSGTALTMAIVLGPCAGEPALEAAMMEYCIMVKDTGMLAAGGPPVVKTSTGLDVSKEELGGTSVHSVITGMVDNVAVDDRDALGKAKQVLSYLPTNAWQYPPSNDKCLPRANADTDILAILPENARRPYNMLDIIDCIVDENSFFEMKAEYGQAILIGFARLNGHSIGIIASQPNVRGGAISGAEGQKTRKFIDLCSAYHVPILSLVDTPGVMTGPVAEREGSLKYGLGAAYALAWANVPVFSVILRKAFGFGGALMGGSFGPQTIALAWPTADFSSLPPDAAIESAHAKELEQAEDRDALYANLMKQYQAFGGPYPAAGILNIDDVVAPNETRARLIHALELTMSRRTEAAQPTLRSGVMP